MQVTLLMFLISIISSISSFAADPVLLNCIETPKIQDVDERPKNFSSSNNLRRKPGSPYVASGKLIYITGRVTDVNCLPIQNAVVSIWHTSPQNSDIHFVKSGRSITNNLGYYNFITIKPGIQAGRARHINFLVQHPDFAEFTTQMFFAGDDQQSNCNDIILNKLLDSGIASLLIIEPISSKNKNSKTYMFNISLNEQNKFSVKR